MMTNKVNVKNIVAITVIVIGVLLTLALVSLLYFRIEQSVSTKIRLNVLWFYDLIYVWFFLTACVSFFYLKHSRSLFFLLLSIAIISFFIAYHVQGLIGF
jgi:hypothetical protein